MTETELQQVLLVRALEAPDAAPVATAADAVPWTAADAQWASDQARRQVGEGAEPGAFVLARAQQVLRRLGQHAPALVALGLGAQADASVNANANAVPAAAPAQRWWLLAPLAAALLGLVGDALVSGQRIQLLGWPLLGLLAWNLLVYLALLVGAWRQRPGRAGRTGQPGQALAPATWQPAVALARRWWPGAPLSATAAAAARLGLPAWLAQAHRQAMQDAWPLTAGLQARRATALMHGCAAALALGAVASMYLRGLGLDYRAGWDSTFLQPTQVQALLALLLAPAQLWPGLAMPDADTLAALRWAATPAGALPGAPAAPWIHRLALALLAWVVLPRLLLALWARQRARRQARQLVLPLQGPYFQRLLREVPHAARPVTVLPYSYHPPADSVAGLAPALADWLGPGAVPECAPVLALGAEDALPAGLPATLRPQVVLLMSLSATPERETHGAMLQQLSQHLRLQMSHHMSPSMSPPMSQPMRQRPGPSATPLLLLDSAGFMQRLAGQPDATQRLQQRVQAWQRMLADLNLPPAQVCNLAAAAADGGPA